MTEKVLASSCGLEQLSGVGEKVKEKLHRLKILSLHDLLFHLPIRYEDRTTVRAISQCVLHDFTQIDASVVSSQYGFGKKRSLIVVVSDGSAHMTCRFFHFNASMRAALTEEGKTFRFYGQIRLGARGYEMMHPEFKEIPVGGQLPLADRLTPVYALTEGLGQKTLARLVQQAFKLARHNALFPDYLAEWLPREQQLVTLIDALHACHYPDVGISLSDLHERRHPFMQRLVIDELVANQLALMRLRKKAADHGAIAMVPNGAHRSQLMQAFGFELTPAQARVEQEILSDLATPIPMMRLVQGDVGCGKTVVAALAMSVAVANGYQAAMMAPTEVLAEQHATNLAAWFEPLGVRVVLVRGQMGAKARREADALLASGGAQVIVGTHALFQKEVVFSQLALVVIDEQHRFGVNQRYALCEKGAIEGKMPHQLIMTATPIPRTMAMTAFAELDYSVIDALPKGRQVIKTLVMEDAKRQDLVRWVVDNNAEGGQVFWVCPLIEESEVLQCQAAEEMFKSLCDYLPDLCIGLVHGRMTSAEKAAVMAQFKSGKIRVLVATTVIEVGVDVPNANMMIIEGSERLGLSQLHQLRGRVGRGSRQSYCVLLYKSPLGKKGGYRLKVMRDCIDGFEIAEKDLRLRGAGEVLGTKQTGLAQYKVADALRDQAVLPEVRSYALKCLDHMEESSQKAFVWRWLGDKDQYTKV